MTKFDIVIIGGGPAGSMTGIRLQKMGYRTCLIDKAVFPRTKLCGGLLTQKSIDLIAAQCPGLNPADFVVEETNSVDFYFKNERVTTCTTEQGYFFTERKNFDHRLVQSYVQAGGTLLENTRIKTEAIDLQANTLRVDDENIGFDFLVGADGCNSILGKKLQLQRHDSFCIEGELDKATRQDKEFRIYFGVAKNGYGWYFPKNNYYSVGIGGDNADKRVRMQADQFFADLSKGPIKQVKGAPIPSGKAISLSKLPPNCLLVGDAAGYIDPITGEGLYYALQSGVLAADAIDRASKAGTKNASKDYLKLVEPIRKELRFAFRLQQILYWPFVLRWFMNYLKTHQSFARFYLEQVMSTNQSSYNRFIWSQLGRKLGLRK